MVFKRDPVVSPGSQSISFDSKIITHASYSENNGDAEFDVTANQPLMATFSNDRKTIVVSAGTVATVANGTPAPQYPGSASSAARLGMQSGAQNWRSARKANVTLSAPQSQCRSSIRRILAVVDPAHGGDERGAALTDTLAEKDVTLGFARLLRHELEIRGFAVQLAARRRHHFDLDQRAAAANVAHAGIYISLHAVSQGSGARVYTALLPVEGTSKGVFHPWNAAQAPALPVSRIVSTAIVAEMQKKEFPVHASSASLRPLNNILMPAVAVELAPGAEWHRRSDLRQLSTARRRRPLPMPSSPSATAWEFNSDNR